MFHNIQPVSVSTLEAAITSVMVSRLSSLVLVANAKRRITPCRGVRNTCYLLPKVREMAFHTAGASPVFEPGLYGNILR